MKPLHLTTVAIIASLSLTACGSAGGSSTDTEAISSTASSSSVNSSSLSSISSTSSSSEASSSLESYSSISSSSSSSATEEASEACHLFATYNVDGYEGNGTISGQKLFGDLNFECNTTTRATVTLTKAVSIVVSDAVVTHKIHSEDSKEKSSDVIITQDYVTGHTDYSFSNSDNETYSCSETFNTPLPKELAGYSIDLDIQGGVSFIAQFFHFNIDGEALESNCDRTKASQMIINTGDAYHFIYADHVEFKDAYDKAYGYEYKEDIYQFWNKN